MTDESHSPRARRLLRFLVLSALYVAQGVTYGFVGSVLVPTLAARGASLEDQAGLLAIGAIPWIFKAAWGPVVDHFGGVGIAVQRRFIVVAHVVMGLSMGAMATIEDLVGSVALVGYLWLLHNVFLSLQDVATDALAIDLLDADERGKANGFMLGGHSVGTFIGGTLIGFAMVSWDLQTGLMVDAAVLLALSAIPMVLRRSDLAPRAVARAREPFWTRLRIAFSHRSARAGLVLALVALLADQMLYGVSGEFLVNRLHVTQEQISYWIVPVDAAAALVGYVLAAAITDRLGHRRLAAIATVALGLLWVAFAFAVPLWETFAFLLVFIAVQAVITAPFRVALHALFMDLTDPVVRATQFVVFMALLNVARTVGPLVGAPLVKAVGFVGVFVAAGAFQVALAAVIRRVPEAASQPVN